MYRLVLFRFTVGVIFILWFLAVSGASVSGKPQIKFEETVYDWGKIVQGENVTHVYRFQNVGDRTLKIDKVKGP